MLVTIVFGAVGLVVGGMNLYQAVTGSRLSKKSSLRSDETMRRQSAIAAAVLLPLAVLCILLALLS